MFSVGLVGVKQNNSAWHKKETPALLGTGALGSGPSKIQEFNPLLLPRSQLGSGAEFTVA